METVKFTSTREWKIRRREVLLEGLAATLPVLLYLLSTVVSRITEKPVCLDHLLSIPDAFFGGCILFALTAIQALSLTGRAKYSDSRPSRVIRAWGLIALGGLIVCACLSVLTIIYHPRWALGVGLVTLFFSYLGYKKVVFCRQFLKAKGRGD